MTVEADRRIRSTACMDPLSRLESLVRPGDALILVPPFGGLDRPMLGAHVLQACAREAGFRVSIVYLNLLFAAEVGEPWGQALTHSPSLEVMSELVFARTAFGVPPLGHDGGRRARAGYQRVREPPLTDKELLRIESLAGPWVERGALIICHRGVTPAGPYGSMPLETDGAIWSSPGSVDTRPLMLGGCHDAKVQTALP